MDKTKRISAKASFLIGALMGALAFVGIFATRVLDVTCDDWLLKGWYDLSQFYVGFELYRASDWHFPIGLCDNSAYPQLASVIYTASIPSVSLFFKLLSPILPRTFQFFGLYGLVCFMLQGGFAKLLTRRIFDSEIAACLGAIPFILSISFIQRTFYHTSLASHFLVLSALAVFVYTDPLKDMKKAVGYWCILGVVSITIHLTFFAMLSVMLLGYTLWAAFEDRKKAFRSACIYLLPFTLFSLSAFALFGGFYGSLTPEAGGLGSFCANLDTLFDPRKYSVFLPALPGSLYQSEGLGYIGIMALILLLPAAVAFVSDLPDILKRRKSLLISSLVSALCLLVIALSPVVHFGQYRLFILPVPDVIYRIWSIFRASGRFIWPITYALIYLVLLYSRRCLVRFGLLYRYLLVLVSLMQLFEFGGYFTGLYRKFTAPVQVSFPADAMEQYDLSSIRHIQFMSEESFGSFYDDEIRDHLIGFTRLALRHGMSVSSFHFSREDEKAITDQIDKSREELESGVLSRDTMYVFYGENEQSYEGCEKIRIGTDTVYLPVQSVR